MVRWYNPKDDATEGSETAVHFKGTYGSPTGACPGLDLGITNDRPKVLHAPLDL